MNTSTESVGAELPRYRCHKEVWALKIKEIRPAPMPEFMRQTCRGSFALGTACGHCERCEWERNYPHLGAIIVPEDARYSAFPVSAEYCRKHNPQPGGYFVAYKDGYQSFSPGAAFEEGYTHIA